jgi:hypothetical protein
MQYSLSNALSNAMPFIRSYWQLFGWLALTLIAVIIVAKTITHIIDKKIGKTISDYDETEIYND